MKTNHKRILFFAFAISSFALCRAQAPNWQQSNTWTLYNIGGAKFYKIAIDSMDIYNHRHLNDDSMHTFLSQAVPIAAEKSPMWMGAWVASCSIGQKKHKIDISSYGGFFFDETEKKYYTIAEGVRRDWLNYFAECAGSIPFKK